MTRKITLKLDPAEYMRSSNRTLLSSAHTASGSDRSPNSSKTPPTAPSPSANTRKCSCAPSLRNHSSTSRTMLPSPTSSPPSRPNHGTNSHASSETSSPTIAASNSTNTTPNASQSNGETKPSPSTSTEKPPTSLSSAKSKHGNSSRTSKTS